MSSSSDENVKAPFGPPDVVWAKGSPSSLPEGVILCGKSDDLDVYAGRTYHEKELLIGSVTTPGICTFSKDGQVHKTSEYQIMSVPVGEPLTWEKVTADNPLPENLVKAGKLENGQILYVGRILRDNGITLVGWVDENKCLHVYEDEKELICDDFEILIHKFLKFLCICPPCPPRRNK